MILKIETEVLLIEELYKAVYQKSRKCFDDQKPTFTFNYSDSKLKSQFFNLKNELYPLVQKLNEQKTVDFINYFVDKRLKNT